VRDKNPLPRAVTGSRPKLIYGTVGERGLAHGAWSLMRNQRGAGVGSGPVASLPHMEPSRCPAGDGSGDTSVALELAPATHVGGTETGPNRADARGRSTAAIHWLELAPHV
jgi:hypothetical protein